MRGPSRVWRPCRSGPVEANGESCGHKDRKEGAKGTVEGLKGKAKEVAGGLSGDPELEREGVAQDMARAERNVARKEAEADAARGEAAAREAEQRSHQR
jgi:uncharacterized protein YjbJ (UPF0337 family)